MCHPCAELKSHVFNQLTLIEDLQDADAVQNRQMALLSWNLHLSQWRYCPRKQYVEATCPWGRPLLYLGKSPEAMGLGVNGRRELGAITKGTSEKFCCDGYFYVPILWDHRYTDIWANTILDISTSMFLDDTNIWISRLSKQTSLPKLKAQTEPKGNCLLHQREFFLSYCLQTKAQGLTGFDINWNICSPRSPACQTTLSIWGLISCIITRANPL